MSFLILYCILWLDLPALWFAEPLRRVVVCTVCCLSGFIYKAGPLAFCLKPTRPAKKEEDEQVANSICFIFQRNSICKETSVGSGQLGCFR
jgi:hypothetical protein